MNAPNIPFNPTNAPNGSRVVGPPPPLRRAATMPIYPTSDPRDTLDDIIDCPSPVEEGRDRLRGLNQSGLFGMPQPYNPRQQHPRPVPGYGGAPMQPRGPPVGQPMYLPQPPRGPLPAGPGYPLPPPGPPVRPMLAPAGYMPTAPGPSPYGPCPYPGARPQYPAGYPQAPRPPGPGPAWGRR